MQNHLCCALALHIVYLGNRLGFPISSTMERFILDAAESMWNKECRFIWTTAIAEYDTDENDEQREELPSNWRSLFTCAYYGGDDYSSQASGPFAGDFHREFPVSNLPVIEEIRILEYLKNSAILNAPSLEESLEFQCATGQIHFPLNVPEPETGWSLPARGAPQFFNRANCVSFAETYATKPNFLHSLHRVISNWLLV
jgi:hypothetical protein